MKKTHVTFDFDSTLSRPEVQDYAAELIAAGVSVWILTARYHELKKHQYTPSPCNEDLYAVADKLGIGRDRIIFTNMKLKHAFLEGSSVLWHLDDLEAEVDAINNKTLVIGINSLESDWKEQCEYCLATENLILS